MDFEKQSTHIVFDLETTGLPNSKGWGLPPFTNNEAYSTCRVVSISWLVVPNEENKNEKEKENEANTMNSDQKQEYFIIKPEGFYVPASATAIHGISQDKADKEGISFDYMISIFERYLTECSTIVAHNIEFDLNVLSHELYRRGMTRVLQLFRTKERVCTMKWGKEVLALTRIPKLSAIYKDLYGVEMENAHNAKYDTWYCYLVYKALIEKTKTKTKTDVPPAELNIKLSEEQKGIVYENPDAHMLVIACAGSGKTTTILCRIWWLIKNGVSPRSITLTTFTRFAADDMRHKLSNIMGYMPSIEIGTIDSLCLKHIRAISSGTDMSTSSGGERSVNEYGHMFLKLLADPDAAATVFAGTRFLFVDEYQDINDVQNDIIQCYRKAGIKIIAIGDDAQNIYGWRGSKMDYILGFEDQMKKDGETHVVVHRLTTNYRSTPTIVALANASIERNQFQYPKTMTALPVAPVVPVILKKHKPLRSNVVPDVRYHTSTFMQNEHIVDTIMRYIDNGVNPHDIAILCYQNQLLYNLEEMLTRVNIPNVFVETKGGNGGGSRSQKQGSVFLGTIHKAKGLEWRIVFLINMNDSIFPSKRDIQGDIEESRRVFYVAVTRAKERLHISFTNLFNSSYVTRFVSELPDDVYSFPNKNERYIGEETSSYVSIKLGVTDMIDSLDGRSMIDMREKGLFPNVEWSRVLLHVEHEHPQFVADNELYADIGIFIDTMMCRVIGGAFSNSHGLTAGSAARALASVKLNKEDMAIYNTYKYMFYFNTRTITHNDTDSEAMKKLSIPISIPIYNPIQQEKEEKQEKGYSVCSHIAAQHESMVYSILHRMREVSSRCQIPLDSVAIMTDRFLPTGFEPAMREHWQAFQNTTTKSHLEALNDIWEVSKCERIVKERRRRLLFRKIPQGFIESYQPLLANIEEHTMPWLMERFSMTNEDPQCHETFRLENGMNGEIDIRWDSTIIDIKCSQSSSISPEWTLQLLIYAYMARIHGLTADTIAILNPLKGLWYEASIEHVTTSALANLVDYIFTNNRSKNQQP